MSYRSREKVAFAGSRRVGYWRGPTRVNRADPWLHRLPAPRSPKSAHFPPRNRFSFRLFSLARPSPGFGSTHAVTRPRLARQPPCHSIGRDGPDALRNGRPETHLPLHPQHGRPDPQRRAGHVAIRPRRSRGGRRSRDPLRVPARRLRVRLPQRERGRPRDQGFRNKEGRAVCDHEALVHLAHPRRGVPRRFFGCVGPGPRGSLPDALARAPEPQRVRSVLPDEAGREPRPAGGLGLCEDVEVDGEAARDGQSEGHRREQLQHREPGRFAQGGHGRTGREPGRAPPVPPAGEAQGLLRRQGDPPLGVLAPGVDQQPAAERPGDQRRCREAGQDGAAGAP